MKVGGKEKVNKRMSECVSQLVSVYLSNGGRKEKTSNRLCEGEERKKRQATARGRVAGRNRENKFLSR